jgi:hypothetical protein
MTEASTTHVEHYMRHDLILFLCATVQLLVVYRESKYFFFFVLLCFTLSFYLSGKAELYALILWNEALGYKLSRLSAGGM